jgi:membrane protein required for colicin V production
VSSLDLAIALVILFSAILALRSGFIRSSFSLAGLLIGLAFSSYNFERFAGELAPMVHSLARAETIWLLLLIFTAMVAAALLGHQVQAAISWSSLGAFDRIFGLALGALRGLIMAMVCIMVIAAFFPQSNALLESRLITYFLRPTAMLSSITSPSLKQRVYEGLSALPAATQRREDAP